MPQSVRSSSIGPARRTTQKEHVPYRLDDLEHGRKTGIAVESVAHGSDDFEDFEPFMRQADHARLSRAAPRGQDKQHRVRESSPGPQSDEGERSMDMSMELEQNTAGTYFSNAPHLTAPSNIKRSHSSNQTADIDFEKIPSPRPGSSFASRRSSVKTSARSYLSHQPHSENDGMAGTDEESRNIPQESPTQPNTSFANMDDDDDVASDVRDLAPIASPQRNKNKVRGVETERDVDMEDDIAAGLNEIDNGGADDAEELESVENSSQAQATRKKRATSRGKKVQFPPTPESPDQDHVIGLRRSTRMRIRPLDFWRLEHVVYGRRESGYTVCPQMKAIVTVPKEEPQPLGGSRRRRKTAKKEKKEEMDADADDLVVNPEDGWDSTTDPYGVVLDYVTKEEVERRLAFTAKMVVPKPAANNDFLFQKVFGDGDFIAAGHLVIPPGKQKPSKSAKDNSYIFYVIEGAVQFKVHRTSFVIANGGMFLVPRGNTYYIENISKRPARLFFSQARKVPVTEDEDPPDVLPQSALSRRSSDPAPASAAKSPGRSSSLGAPARSSTTRGASNKRGGTATI